MPNKKNRNKKKQEVVESESDDSDLPELEDMTDKITEAKQKQQELKEKQDKFFGVKAKQSKDKQAETQDDDDDDGEEIRLAPKPKANTVIKSTDETQEVKKKIEEVKVEPKQESQQKPQQQPQQKKKQPSGGFGGFAAGFLNAKPQKKKAPAVQVKKEEQKQEDLTHIKAKGKDETLKIDEVQDAMKAGQNLLGKKDEWMNQDFMAKMMKNPKLMQKMADPKYAAAFQEFGKDPKGAMEKYGNNPEFRDFMKEFSEFMGGHFEDLANKKDEEEKKKKEEELERIKNDPITKIIETDPQVKAILNEPKIKMALEELQRSGGMDMAQKMAEDPDLGRKMMILVQKGVLNANTEAPR